MPNSRGGQDKASWIASLRARVEQAWRLARRIHNEDASKNLQAYATELEARLLQLEAQADDATPPAREAAADAAREPAPAEADAGAKASPSERKS
jgi:hypothetical protein